MKRSIFALAIFAFSIVAGPAESVSSPDYAALNERIFSHLELLKNKGETARAWAGGVTIGLGALTGAGGLLVVSSAASSSDPQMALGLGYGIVALGALVAVIGIPIIAIPSKSEGTFRKYAAYPGETGDDIKVKAQKGERNFRDLADESKRDRILGGGIDTAMGIGYILYSGSYYGAFLVGTGLAYLLIDSDPEKEWKIYLEEKQELARN
ncbi:MAG: hypothetical protein WCQ50_05265 [Spirochaetota bacterium]